MRGAPHRRARSSARSFFLLPLVLALLALVAFPVFAHAAGIPQYEVKPEETEIPRETIGKPKSSGGQHHQKSETQQKAEGSDAEGATGSEGTPEEESEGSSSHHKATGGGTPGGGNGPGTEGGSGGEKPSSGGGSPESGVSQGKDLGGTESQAGVNAANKSEGGGGSSPVVPILIAVIVLAAISIGVVIYRQRKDESGHDGPVSSRNAS